ncbi:hypothetical protein EKO04_010789 [Ascochyta lentis]|uniref:Uncharacterized protein n=1 Tax=Ascochyta lentis TaxID=205686 RepID=A0A8H7IT34_9PLEO|nr:hypothetical protein EKO04_010789 [Ascochyta lentis]
MAFFKGWVNQQPTGGLPHIFEDDDVYPVHVLDDTKTFRGILITWTICFNDALDADKLRSSLARLLELGDWRKIGGRLRLKENGALEIHVPPSFTAQRPAFSYSHELINTAVEDHAVAKDLPKSDGSVSMWPGPDAFADFAARPDAPTTLEDLLSGDVPQISVHITSFTNATLVALSWPHTMMDVMGQHAFLDAWSLVLAGRESEVPPVLGAREDTLCALVDAPAQRTEELNLKSKQLKGLSMLKFGARMAWKMLTGPTPETRTICLPKETMTKLRLQAQTDLAELSHGGEAPFVSDGDLLAAWTIRAVATSLADSRPITALHAMNVRFRLPLLVNAQGVYLQNMLVPGFTFVSSDVARGPMGPIALINRQSLMEQATEAQVLASLREQRVSGDPSRLLYGDADAVLIPFTDWTKAKFFDTANFSPAVLHAGDISQTRRNSPGTPVFHHASSRRPTQGAGLMVVVLGKDQKDNYWLTLTLSPLAWLQIGRSLEELE